jgi:DNA-binding MarR family transcriptional regulator
MKQRQGGFLIAKVHRTAGRVFSRMLRERNIEINPAQGRILFVLWQEGPMSALELAKRVSLGRSTLTSALDRLESQGRVVRVPCSDDKRRIILELTPQNEAMHKLYHAVSKQMTEAFYTGFRNDEIAEFEQCLERILNNLSKLE